jgi:hypothetical protein
VSENAGTLAIDFAAETARFRAELERVNDRLRRVEGAFGQIQKAAKQFIGGLSVAAFGAFIKSSADAADELGKTADRLNIGAERLKKFQIAAENTGVSVETANGLLTTAQKRLGEAAAGGGAAAKTIAALGLNVKELQRLSPDELFIKYSEAINQLKDRNEQAAAATDLLGNSAAEALNFVKSAGSAVDDASAFVDKFGLALSRVEIGQIEAANDSLGNLKKVADGTGQRLALGLAPFVKAIGDSLLEATGSTNLLQDALSVIGGAGYVAVQILANTAHLAEAAFFGLAAAAARVLQFLTFGDVSEAFKASVDANLAKADAALQKIKSEQQILQGLEKVFDDSLSASIAAEEAKRVAAAGGGTKTLAEEDFANQLSIRELQNQQLLTLEDDQSAAIIAAQQRVTASLDEELAKQVQIHGSYNDVILRQEQAAEQARVELKQFGYNAAVAILAAFAGKSKTFAKLQVAINKAETIALAIQNTKAAITHQLKTGDPYTAKARAVAVGIFGALQVAAIAKTGFNEIGAISDSGGAPIGSPTNPVFTQDPSEAPGNIGSVAGKQAGQSVIQLVINGNFFQTKDTVNFLVERLREELNDKDVVLFSPSSQQALQLGAGQ